MSKRKLISVILALMLTFALVSCFASCDRGTKGEQTVTEPTAENPTMEVPTSSGGDTASCAHEYSNLCDAECNICGEKRSVGEHKYTDENDASCDICGALRELGCSHTYDNACDATCNTCGEERTPSAHVATTVRGQAATCTSTGLSDGSVCSVCNTVLKEQEIIPAAGHKWEITAPEKAASCTEDGNTEGKECSVCGEAIAPESIPATGHVYGDDNVCDTCGHVKQDGHTHSYTSVVTPPTCTEGGYTTHTCDCGESYTDAQTSPKGHSEVIDAAVAPTCTTSGLTQGKHCSVCQAVITEQTVLSPKGHTEVIEAAVAPTCTTSGLTLGKYCSVCNTVIMEQMVINPKGHTEVIDAAVAPTCTSTGLTAGKHCSVCNTVITAQTIVSAKGHTEVVDAAVAPTCTSTGLTAGKHCSACGEILTKQEIVNATGHKYVEGGITKYGSDEDCHWQVCRTCGYEDKESKAVHSMSGTICTVCGYGCTHEVGTAATCTAFAICKKCGLSFGDALGHNEDTVVAGYAATCSKEGLTDEYSCSRCGEVQKEAQPISKLPHTPVKDAAVAPDCENTGLSEGSHCGVCGEIIEKQTVIEAKGHDAAITIPAVKPTCSSTGLTEGKKCSACGKPQVAQQTVDKLEHTVIIDAAVAPTCTSTGLTEGSRCGACGEVLVKQEVVNAKGHDTNKSIPAVAPTCTTTGLSEGKRCSVCGAIQVAQQTVSALGHTTVTDAAVNPTCTTTGLTEGSHCNVCNEVIVAQKTVDALGHTEVADSAKAPTCTEAGLTEGSHCGVCGIAMVEQETIDALGHTEVTDAAKAPTCTEAGLTEGSHCNVCNTVITAQQTVTALGHEAVSAWTYDENGHHYNKCVRDCGQQLNLADCQSTNGQTCDICGGTYGCRHSWSVNTSTGVISCSGSCGESYSPDTFANAEKLKTHYAGTLTVTNNYVTYPAGTPMAQFQYVDTTPLRYMVIYCKASVVTTIRPIYYGTAGTVVRMASVGTKWQAFVFDMANPMSEDSTSVWGISPDWHGSGASLDVMLVATFSSLGDAQKYEELLNYDFECNHTNTVTTPAVAATCESAGKTEGIKCNDCGIVVAAQQSISALGHEAVSTWTYDGNGRHYHKCVRDCGYQFDIAVCQSASGSTCDTCGGEYGGCSHNWSVNTSTGVISCSGSCGGSFAPDTFANAEKLKTHYAGTLTVTGNYVTYPEGGAMAQFQYVDATPLRYMVIYCKASVATTIRPIYYGTSDTVVRMTTVGTKWKAYVFDMANPMSEDSTSVWGISPDWNGSGASLDVMLVATFSNLEDAQKYEGLLNFNYSDECSHTNETTLSAVAATCTSEGKTAGSKCNDCGLVLTAQQSIAALGHEAVSAWTYDGNGQHYHKCVRDCGYQFNLTACQGTNGQTCDTCGGTYGSAGECNHKWTMNSTTGAITCSGTCGKTYTPATYATVTVLAGGTNASSNTDKITTDGSYIVLPGRNTQFQYVNASMARYVVVRYNTAHNNIMAFTYYDTVVAEHQLNIQTLIGDSKWHTIVLDMIEPISHSPNLQVYGIAGDWNGSGESVKISTIATFTSLDAAQKYAEALDSQPSASCMHLNYADLDAVAATCAFGGKTAGAQCVDCGVVLKAQTATSELGHSRNSGGVCTRCGSATTVISINASAASNNIAGTNNSTATFTTYSGVPCIKFTTTSTDNPHWWLNMSNYQSTVLGYSSSQMLDFTRTPIIVVKVSAQSCSSGSLNANVIYTDGTGTAKMTNEFIYGVSGWQYIVYDFTGETNQISLFGLSFVDSASASNTIYVADIVGCATNQDVLSYIASGTTPTEKPTLTPSEQVEKNELLSNTTPVGGYESYNKETAANEDKEINLWFNHTYTRTPQSQVSPEGLFSYKIMLARNEIEGCQLILSSSASKTGLSISVSDFVHTDGSTKMTSEVLMGYYFDIDGEMVIDPLPPTQGNFATFSLNNTSQTFVIKAKSSQTQKAGEYSATVIIKNSSGQEVKKVTVFAYVWNFMLPEATSCKVLTDLDYSSLYTINQSRYTTENPGSSWYSSEGYNALVDADAYKQAYDFLLENRICAYNIPGITHPSQYGFGEGTESNGNYDSSIIEYLSNPRVVAFLNLGWKNTITAEKIQTSYNSLYGKTDSEGTPLLDKAYFYPVDEAKTKTELDKIISTADAIKAVYGNDYNLIAPMHMTGHIVGSNGTIYDFFSYVAGAVTAWCPKTFFFNTLSDYTTPNSTQGQTVYAERNFGTFAERMAAEQAGGDEVWWYVTRRPNDPETTLIINTEATRYRLMFWQQKLYNVDSFLYYLINDWAPASDGAGVDNAAELREEMNATSAWYSKHEIGGSANYDVYGNGVLIYTGCMVEWTYTKPVGSLRLECVRDGIEDYEYFTILEEHIGKDKVDMLINELTTSVISYDTDAEKMAFMHEALGALIEIYVNT